MNERLTIEQEQALSLIIASAVVLECRGTNFIMTTKRFKPMKKWSRGGGRKRIEKRDDICLGHIIQFLDPEMRRHSFQGRNGEALWRRGELDQLRKFRNKLSHGNLEWLSNNLANLRRDSITYYNAAISAIAAMWRLKKVPLSDIDCLDLLVDP